MSAKFNQFNQFKQVKKIIHIDMDAFFASVEQLDKPELKGLPVAVGGSPDKRGVVAAASYEAREFGVRSAMSSFQAQQRCRNLVFVKPRIARYKEISLSIHEIFNRYTNLIEPLSLDEAYLDVSDSSLLKGSATLIAQAIKHDIYKELNLIASAGVSYNKFLAKLASDMDKPNGLFVIKPDEAISIIQPLQVKKLFGVGKVTAKKLNGLGIHTIGDIEKMGLDLLRHHFGKQGDYYYNLSQGIDHRKVNTSRTRKSIGQERTYNEDLLELDSIKKELRVLLKRTYEILSAKSVVAKTVTLKVKYFDFKQVTRQFTLTDGVYSLQEAEKQLLDLIPKTKLGATPARLLGISFSGLVDEAEVGETYEEQQESLFE